jgi:hypothetical protein
MIYGALVEWCWQQKIEILWEKLVPVPVRPPQIPHGLSWYRNQPLVWEADDWLGPTRWIITFRMAVVREAHCYSDVIHDVIKKHWMSQESWCFYSYFWIKFVVCFYEGTQLLLWSAIVLECFDRILYCLRCDVMSVLWYDQCNARTCIITR